MMDEIAAAPPSEFIVPVIFKNAHSSHQGRFPYTRDAETHEFLVLARDRLEHELFVQNAYRDEPFTIKLIKCTALIIMHVASCLCPFCLPSVSVVCRLYCRHLSLLELLSE